MTLNVLYVDDEPDIREVAVMSLEIDDGIAVEAVASGREALDRLAERPFDVILLDVMMPDLDGPATLDALRARGDATPVVFITARAQSHEQQRFLQLGAVGIITKPFDPMTLAVELRAVLARAS